MDQSEWPQEGQMRTYRYGRKLILPSTIAIKHQIRKLMAEDEINKAAEHEVNKAEEKTRVDLDGHRSQVSG
jgi:hypothetical protein